MEEIDEHSLLYVWTKFPDVVKSLIRDDPLEITLEALKWAEKIGNWKEVAKAIEILDFIAEMPSSEGE